MIFKKFMSGVLSAVMTLSMIPSVFAAQSDGSNYVNPADSWISTSTRTSEMDINAIKTEETFNCDYCKKQTLFTVFRVPEYANDGTSVAAAGMSCTDGTWAYTSDGSNRVRLSGVSPRGRKYTGYHWTKAVCNTCGYINSNLDYNEEAAAHKNYYVLNPCDGNFFQEFDNSEYSYHDSETHTTVKYTGEYCQFCFGTDAEKEESITEPHDIEYTISPEEGNHRFHKEGICEECGYNFDGYSIAKSVVADYYGIVDGLAHTVTVADFSDSDVHTRITYGTEPNNITLTSAPNFTQAGSYSVWYDINYYIGESQFSEIGEAKVILYEDDTTASLASTQPTPENHAHDYSYRYTIDPTCTKLGYEIWQCDGCGDIEMRNPVAATNHSYKEYVIREATCQQGGYILHICENCGDSYYESNSTTAHTYYEDTIPATCTTPGYTKVTCSVCGASYTKDITAVKGHNFRTEVIAPTCTEQGYTTYICNDCGYNYKSDYTQPTGHKWDGGHVISNGSCNSEGVKEYDCTVCGEKRFEAVSATGHKAGKPATCTEPQVCTDCGAVLAPPTGHSYKAALTAPTCTEKGFTTYTCTKCGDSYTDDYTEPLGHHFHEVVTNPTCTELGYTTYTCTKGSAEKDV